MKSKEEILDDVMSKYPEEATKGYRYLKNWILEAMEECANQFKSCSPEEAPFPDKMSFREMLTELFATDFMTSEELTTICDAGEMYARGCIKRSINQEGQGELISLIADLCEKYPCALGETILQQINLRS